MRITALSYVLLAAMTISCDNDGLPGNFTGKSGSLARFATTDTHLFSVDDESLNVFQIMGNGSLEQVNSRFLGPGVETIFALGGRLYIGTNSSMIIYDIINPASPNFMSQYSHFVGCDPVVVQDTLAFVTIRSNNCNGSDRNTLDILNIKNAESPSVLSNYMLQSPYGLGVDGNLLFVCEGDNGLKVFDISNPYNAVLLVNYNNVNAFDAITNKGVLIVTGIDGIVQYDYSNQNLIKKLSEISVSR